MSVLQTAVERAIGRIKGDPSYRLSDELTDRQLAIAVWHRGWQRLRGFLLPILARGVRAPVFRGRGVVIEHVYALVSGPGLILEDGVLVNALARDGIHLGRNVTIARASTLLCTGVISTPGVGIRIGDRSAVGSGSFLAGQGGITIGDDVIMGAGVRIFSENHVFDRLDLPIRAQGTSRRGVSISNDCWIGAGATILDGVSIGPGCVVAAGAVVTEDVPALSIVAGVPARVISSRDGGSVAHARREGL